VFISMLRAVNSEPDAEPESLATWLTWTPDGRVFFGGFEGDAAFAPLEGVNRHWTPAERIRQLTAWGWGTNLSCHGRKNLGRRRIPRQPRSMAAPIGQWNKYHRKPSSAGVGEPKSLRWKSAVTTARRLPTRRLDPAKKYPMVVEVHGGPGARCSRTGG